MKLIAVLSLVAAVAMTSLPLVIASDYSDCHNVDSQIPFAISKLCNHPRLKVPGGVTSKGAKYGNVRVKILGNCQPKKHHVGTEECLSRFFDVCAQQGDSFMKTGQALMDVGCERYYLKRTKGPPYKHKGELWHPGLKKDD